MALYTNINKLTGLIFLLFVSCSKSDQPAVVLPPDSAAAAFMYSFDPENPNKVLFQGTEDINAWYRHWSFGDNTSAEGQEVEKTYPLKGDYQVRYKIFTEGGTAEQVQTVSIEADLLGPDLIQNGNLTGEDHWTKLPISDGVEVTFENGVASWSGGNWGHVGIYQAFEVEANQLYQANMFIKGGGLTDCWFEVYVGKTAPMPFVDYTDGGIRLGLNTWEGCGVEPFEGLFSAVSCSGGDGTFQFAEAGTVYLVIRGGGVDFGQEGVTIDDVSVRPF